jgi:hypothetical protein
MFVYIYITVGVSNARKDVYPLTSFLICHSFVIIQSQNLDFQPHISSVLLPNHNMIWVNIRGIVEDYC